MNDAEKLFFTGGGHARAAHALILAANTDIHMNVPFYLLVGFAFETVLKAAYLHLGGNMDAAKHEVRHSLPKALAYARDQGFQPENEQVAWLVETMEEVHLNHAFRYLTGEDTLKVADATISLDILDDLVAQVGQLLYPEHDKAHWVGLLRRYDRRHT